MNQSDCRIWVTWPILTNQSTRISFSTSWSVISGKCKILAFWLVNFGHVTWLKKKKNYRYLSSLLSSYFPLSIPCLPLSYFSPTHVSIITHSRLFPSIFTYLFRRPSIYVSIYLRAYLPIFPPFQTLPRAHILIRLNILRFPSSDSNLRPLAP